MRGSIDRRSMRAHVGTRGWGAEERRKRAEWTRRDRAVRPARTREPGALAAVDHERRWAVRGGEGGDAMHLDFCAWFVRCLLFRAPPGSLYAN